MTTGITMPASLLVAALNSLQNAMILTPCWPRAGPTGGAGLACPAGICSLMIPVTFFAIKTCLSTRGLCLLDLPVFEFNRRVAAKNIHRHLQFSPVGLNFLDHTTEIEER